MGEHTCPRWHRDHYCGRGIVSYNLSGTQYVAEVGTGGDGLRRGSEVYKESGPLPVVNGVITPLIGVITLVTHV